MSSNSDLHLFGRVVDLHVKRICLAEFITDPDTRGLEQLAPSTRRLIPALRSIFQNLHAMVQAAQCGNDVPVADASVADVSNERLVAEAVQRCVVEAKISAEAMFLNEVMLRGNSLRVRTSLEQRINGEWQDKLSSMFCQFDVLQLGCYLRSVGDSDSS